MRSLRLLVLVAALVALPSRAAQAQSASTNALANCLVRATTAEDRTTFVRWMFGVMALHPAVQAMSAVTPEARTELNRGMATILERLLTASCAGEARLALQQGGTPALTASFNVFGQVAAEELFGHPAVAAGVAEFGTFLDAEKLGNALNTAKD